MSKVRKQLKLDFIFEDTKDLLQESLEGTKRVSEIVQNLKSFSHVDEAKLLQTDINNCIEQTLKIIWNEFGQPWLAHEVGEYQG